MSLIRSFRYFSTYINKYSPKMSKLNKSSGAGEKKAMHVTQHAFKSHEENAKFQILATPIKSSSDKKDYRVIRLENSLTVCLISDKSPIEESAEDYESESESSFAASDEEAELSDVSDQSEQLGRTKSNSDVEQKMAAAGLCIGVGSFSDPKDVPGMAHFLEHMVFMGSEKFPSENDFDSFIKKGGGSDNASTDAETTCFYFECLEKHLHEALDKFAQFFIAPLMKREAMTREREAIESEFQMALPSDTSRKEQLLCSLSQEDSPVNTFAWGNLVTLRDNISDDKLYEGVHQFRRRHYSAHRMTLAVQARLPMETLEHYTLECFTNIPNNNLPPDDFSQFSASIFDTPQFTRMYYVKPMKDLCQVDLTWSLPSFRDKYKSKPHEYISHLMGDEGKGSLLSFLRNRVWAITTSIGNGESGTELNSIYSLYTVSIVLTEEGLKHLDEVIAAVFSYLHMLKNIGPQERVFNEMKLIADTAFRFAREDPAVDTVEDLCENMQIYPPEDYIAGSELYYEYDPEAMKMIMDLLEPNKMNVMVLSKKLPENIEYDKTEKWFGTKYTDREIPADWIEKWKSVEPYPEFNIPSPNPFLTTDFSILEKHDNHPEYPERLFHNPLFEIWYRQDQKFGLPLAYYYLYLISPLSIKSARSNALLDMMMNFLVYSLTEEAYPAVTADLSYDISSYEKGLLIKVYGYNQKLPVLIDLISKQLITFGDAISPEVFEAVKDKLIKSYHNKAIKPSSLAKDVRLVLLVNNVFTTMEKHAELQSVTLDELKDYCKEFIKTLYIKSLVQGNVTAKEASDTVKRFIDAVNFTEMPTDVHPKYNVVQIPKGEKCFRIQSFNKHDSNSIITNYYQAAPFTIRNSVIIDIIMLIIEEPLFDILRTKEQLGYNVYCSLRDTFGVLGYTITVNAQATKHSTAHVDTRIEEFLKHTNRILEKTTEDELKQIKEDLIKTKLCADTYLKEEVDRNWTEIISDDYIFDRLKQEIAAIEDVSLKEVRTWWKRHNKFGDKENFRKLTIQVVGHKVEQDAAAAAKNSDTLIDGKLIMTILSNPCPKQKKDQYFITDVEDFKSSLVIFPVVKRLPQ
nr:unnamed protein product [Callosobruchus analis]